MFASLPGMSEVWAGPPVPESELAAWVTGLTYFTTISVDSVLSLITPSGNAFELYGEGQHFLNPIRLARSCCWAIQAHAPEENEETLGLAVQAWRRYVDAVVHRMGPPARISDDGEAVYEAVWLPDGDDGPHVRLWLNQGMVLNPGNGLFGKLAGSALIRLDVHAPAELPSAEVPSGGGAEVNDVPEWIPPVYQEHAVEQARLAHAALRDEDRLVERIRHVLGGAALHGGSVRAYLGHLSETSIDELPDVDSYLSAHTFRHPDAPQGRLPAVHMAAVIAAIVSQTTDGEARVLEMTEPGAALHYYDLFDPRIQNALALTGSEACAVWRILRESYTRSAVGKTIMVAPPDVQLRLRGAAAEAGERP
ncbi:hypothetical protein [Streptomyces sp. NPDC001927]